MTSQSGWIARNGVENTKICGIPYLQKSYLKTGSLMARGLRATVMLGGCVQGEIWREVAYAYGRNFGIAFQVSCHAIFDMIDGSDLFSL